MVPAFTDKAWHLPRGPNITVQEWGRGEFGGVGHDAAAKSVEVGGQGFEPCDFVGDVAEDLSPAEGNCHD